MKYEVKNNFLIVYDLNEFNIGQILECGQTFRFKKLSEDTYEFYSLDKFAIAKTCKDRCEITSSNLDYFIEFLDLNTNYTEIKNSLVKINNYISNAVEFGYGIRILKQDIFEMFVSFIISANNNIKRIKASIFKICEKFGTNMGNFYAFPTYNQLLSATKRDFVDCGLGYRADQLYNALRQLNIDELYSNKELNSLKLGEYLQSFSGIGPKVADCIMLFGYGKQDVFPVDTWIEKAYNTMNNCCEISRYEIRNNLVKTFGNLSGYAQQYMFYYKRSEKL